MGPREPSALPGAWPPAQTLALPPPEATTPGPLSPCQGAPGVQGKFPDQQGTSLPLPPGFSRRLRGPRRTQRATSAHREVNKCWGKRRGHRPEARAGCAKPSLLRASSLLPPRGHPPRTSAQLAGASGRGQAPSPRPQLKLQEEEVAGPAEDRGRGRREKEEVSKLPRGLGEGNSWSQTATGRAQGHRICQWAKKEPEARQLGSRASPRKATFFTCQNREPESVRFAHPRPWEGRQKGAGQPTGRREPGHPGLQDRKGRLKKTPSPLLNTHRVQCLGGSSPPPLPRNNDVTGQTCH